MHLKGLMMPGLLSYPVIVNCYIGVEKRTTRKQSYTAKNAADLMQVVDFTALMQFANKLYQTC